MKIIIPLLLILPCALQAQIYRCEAKGETYFSQIPCADNAEAVSIEDRQMFSEDVPGKVAPPEEPANPVEPVRTPADNMQEFVTTLQRQRSEQLQQIDRDIEKLEVELNAVGDQPANASERKALGEQLMDLQTTRSSMVEEYEAMIVEAARRVIALAASGSSEEAAID